jgi:kinesin family member C2/C3
VQISYLFNLWRIVICPAGQKFCDVFQLKNGSYSGPAAAKISEMMHSNSLDVSTSRILPPKLLNYATLLFDVSVMTLIIFSQNAPTQSLISVVNGILDESIERKKGEIPHVCVHFELHHYLSIDACLTVLKFDCLISACSLLTAESRSRD